MSLSRCWMALGVWALLVTAAFAAPLNALIINGKSAIGFNHNWKESTPILKKLLEQNDQFKVDVITSPEGSQDASTFHPDFNKYQLVVLDYAGDHWPTETMEALAKFVADGGGLLVYHGADNAFPKSELFNELIGLGGWNDRNEKNGPYVYYKDGKEVRDTTAGVGGSHGKSHVYTITLRDKEHPITKGLPEKFQHGPDELYDRLRGPAKNLTILATAYSDKSTGGTGRDEPILMTVNYGKGRVFHSVLGHAAKQINMPSFTITFLRGAEWAATGKVTQTATEGLQQPNK